jgi:hypothetical protein
MLSLRSDKKIQDILKKTTFNFLEKDQIKEYSGNRNIDIDYLINFSDNILCIKDKNEIRTPSLSNIKDFIESTDLMARNTNRKCIGIYISYMPLNKESVKLFEDQKCKTSNKYYYIDHKNRDYLLKKLIEILYENNIFMYDEDESCIMLDK